MTTRSSRDENRAVRQDGCPVTPRIRVECNECGRKFWTTSSLPTCPKCGGADIELAEAYPGDPAAEGAAAARRDAKAAERTTAPLMHAGSILNSECGCKECQRAIDLIAVERETVDTLRFALARFTRPSDADIAQRIRALLARIDGV